MGLMQLQGSKDQSNSMIALVLRTMALLLVASLAMGTQAARADEAMDWLNRAATAAKQLNYSGVYVYHHGEYVEVMRVSHRRDASGEQEKVEVMDDVPRTFLRVNKDVFCHLPDGKTVRMEKNIARRFFPALLPEKPEELLRSYDIKLGGTERVAGANCQVVILEPRDDYRHGFNLWIDKRSGLPLKSRIVNNNGGVVSMFVFSEIQIGRAPDAQFFRQDLIGKKILMASLEQQPAGMAWDVSPPPGYVRVLEAIRPMPGKKLPVTHWVFSDGLSALSVFIEPGNEEGSLQGLSAESSMGIYSHQVDGYKVTTIGEVPNGALIETGNSVKKK
jgi:sigma-E factor negative regulatory protein RseB